MKLLTRWSNSAKGSEGRSGRLLVGILILVSALYQPSVFAAEWQNAYQESSKTLALAINKSTILNFKSPIKQVTVANPKIVDIIVLGRERVYIVGKSVGTTNILVLGADGSLLNSVDVEVGHDLLSLKRGLHNLLPDESIDVYSSQGSIILRGTVSSIASLDAALDLARSYLPGGKGGDAGGIINMLQVGGAQQVMLEVKIAEVSRELMKRMNMDFHFINSSGKIQVGAVNGGATFPNLFGAPVFPNNVNPEGRAITGPGISRFIPSNNNISDKGLFLSFLEPSYLFSAILDIAKDNGLAKILAEPNLTTLTGQEAKFLAGGEFPIPVPQGVNGIGIEFKEFGVGLAFLPTVLDEHRINISLNVSVSDILNQNSVVLGDDNTNSRFFVPALTKRSVQTTVELADGESLGIAGLISETLRESVSKFPGLGDVPIFGALFRDQEFIKKKTELVIFVTPHFAKTIDKKDISYPFDDFVEPSDAEFFLMGKLQGEKKPPQYETTPDQSGFVGTAGHQLGTE